MIQYGPHDKMCDLICEDHAMLFVLSRFGIPMGFGDNDIEEVCKRNNVDVKTFLAIVNMNRCGAGTLPRVDRDLHPESIVKYLHNSHEYFLDYRLPSIRARLLEAMDGEKDVAVVIMRYFDEYATEVRKHMEYEERVVFPYIQALVGGDTGTDYHISTFRKQHGAIESRLNELRDILIKYYTGTTGHVFNAVLFDIFTCADDLRQHNTVEDCLLVPLIELLEKEGSWER